MKIKELREIMKEFKDEEDVFIFYKNEICDISDCCDNGGLQLNVE